MDGDISWVNVVIASVAVCFLLAGIPVLSCAGAAIPVSFDPSGATLQRGQELRVDVVVGTVANPAYNVTSDEIAFVFDPAILHVESVTAGPYLATSGYGTLPMTPLIDNVNGLVSGAAESIIGSNVAPTGTGVVWTITFSATGEGSSEVNFTRVWLAEPPGMPEDLLPVVITKGIFTVTGGAGAPGSIPTEKPAATAVATPPGTATTSPTPAEPGFEAVVAIAGLLGVAHLVLRRRGL